MIKIFKHDEWQEYIEKTQYVTMALADQIWTFRGYCIADLSLHEATFQLILPFMATLELTFPYIKLRYSKVT